MPRQLKFLLVFLILLTPPNASALERFYSNSDFVQFMAGRFPNTPLFSTSSADSITKEQLYYHFGAALVHKGIKLFDPLANDKPLLRKDFINISYAFVTGTIDGSFSERKTFLKDMGIISPNDVGLIMQFEGNVIRMPVPNGGDKKIAGSEPVLLGDTFETEADSRIEIRLDDMSLVNLAGNSALSINRVAFNKKKKFRSVILKLEHGKIRVRAQDYSSKKHDFEIFTPTAIVGAEGAEFIVSVDTKGNTQLMVVSGKAAIRRFLSGQNRDKEKNNVTVKPGYSSSLFAGSKLPSKPVKVTERERKRAIESTTVLNPEKIVKGIREREIIWTFSQARDIYAGKKRKQDKTPEAATFSKTESRTIKAEKFSEPTPTPHLLAGDKPLKGKKKVNPTKMDAVQPCEKKANRKSTEPAGVSVGTIAEPVKDSVQPEKKVKEKKSASTRRVSTGRAIKATGETPTEEKPDRDKPFKDEKKVDATKRKAIRPTREAMERKSAAPARRPTDTNKEPADETRTEDKRDESQFFTVRGFIYFALALFALYVGWRFITTKIKKKPEKKAPVNKAKLKKTETARKPPPITGNKKKKMADIYDGSSRPAFDGYVKRSVRLKPETKHKSGLAILAEKFLKFFRRSK